MKNKLQNLFVAFIASALSLQASAQSMAASPAAEFFPDGKAGKISGLYFQLVNNDEGKPNVIKMWLTQPDDIFSLGQSLTETDDLEAWAKKHKYSTDGARIQIDCKVDNGKWQYRPDLWDIGEMQEEIPYDMVFTMQYRADWNRQSYRLDTNLMDATYGDDENCAFLKPAIVMDRNDSNRNYFNLAGHSLSFRTRYILRIETPPASGDDSGEEPACSYIYSDWSDTVTIGKGATQTELKAPAEIEAPAISQLTFLSAEKNEDGYITSQWKVFVEFPNSNGLASRYYSVYMDCDSALSAVIQYRVYKDGEWSDWNFSDWGNPDWLFSGWKSFTAEGVGSDDRIEFRVFLENHAEPDKKSHYSNSLFCNAGDALSAKIPEGGNEKGATAKPPAEKKKCSLCATCPVQPLGICLFIWIAAAVILAAVIYFKARGKERR